MANLTITNNAPNGVVIWEPVFEDDTLAATGAVTYLLGTLLARKSVADAVTEAADNSYAEKCEGCGFGGCRNRDVSIGFTKVGQHSLVKSCEGKL